MKDTSLELVYIIIMAVGLCAVVWTVNASIDEFFCHAVDKAFCAP